jgi:hypothetical protein
MQSYDEEESEDEIQLLLERLWSLDRVNQHDEFDEVECELMEAVRENPGAAHSYYSTGTAGGPSDRQTARLLWHICATGCSFDLIVRVHFENEQACRERQQSFQGALPLHMACKSQCDVTTITFLAKQYPGGRDEVDDEMNYPLHIVLLSHPSRAELVRVLQTPNTLTDLTVPWRDDGFPMDVLDAITNAHAYPSIALETNPTNRDSENIILSSSRFHGFCSDVKDSLRVTVGLHLAETLAALARYRIPLVALNIKFFEELPLQEIAEIDTLSCLFLQKGSIPHAVFADLLQVLSTKPHFTRLHVRSSRTLLGSSPIELLALTTLGVLDLGYNTIGPSLADPLAQVLLASHCRLHQLDVGGNDIGKEGMQIIYSALGCNKTVQILDMVGEVTDGLVPMLRDENTTLSSINVGMTHPLREAIDFWCRSNRCQRGRLCEEGATKVDLIDILLAARSIATHDIVGISFVLLLTNPALWSSS